MTSGVALPHQRLSLGSMGFALRSFLTDCCASGVRCFSAMSATSCWPLHPPARNHSVAPRQASSPPARTDCFPHILSNLMRNGASLGKLPDLQSLTDRPTVY